MNKRLRAAVLGAALLTAAGCQDLTEVPADFVAQEYFYRNSADAVAAVNSIYASFVNLPSPFSSNDYVGRNWVMLVEYPTEYTTSRLSAGNERSLIGTFHPQFTPSHAYLEGVWKAAYAGINRANAAIGRIPAIEMNETRKAQLIGEAKFLRALHYYWLAGLFGALPLKLTETTTIEEASANTPRASAEGTWAQIAKDLTDAAAALPVSWPATDFGRATRGAANTLLGKAYLHSAATVPSLTGNFQKAIDAFKLVTGYSLASNYASLFNGTAETSSEIIFSFQNIRVSGAGGRLTEWFSPITAPPVWAPGAQNQFQAERPFYESYAATDVRKDATWMTSFVNAGRTITWAYTSGIQTAANYGSTGPVPRKYVDWGSPDTGSDGIDYVILRYADVLLSLAEAINEVSGPTAEAYGYVNQVRTRAGLPALTAGLSKPAFKDAVFLERKYELAMEFHGVFDMRRNWDWARARVEANMKLARTAAGGGTDINRTAPNSSFNSNVEKCTVGNGPICYTPIADKWKLYPVPAHAIELNPLLTQNPGW
jgi:starch-binding outer membrane protein, SusD/RagB family